MSDQATKDEALVALGQLFVECSDERMRMTGRAERAEAEVDLLSEKLELAVGYIRACAEQGDGGAQAILRMIFPVESDPQSVEAVGQ